MKNKSDGMLLVSCLKKEKTKALESRLYLFQCDFQVGKREKEKRRIACTMQSTTPRFNCPENQIGKGIKNIIQNSKNLGLPLLENQLSSISTEI